MAVTYKGQTFMTDNDLKVNVLGFWPRIDVKNAELQEKVGGFLGGDAIVSYAQHLVSSGMNFAELEEDILADSRENDLDEIIKHFSPTQLAIETLFFSKNKKTALRVSEARGVIIAKCLDHSLEVFEYDPVKIKMAVTGNGAANKEAVEKMVRMQVSGSMNKHIDDAIDAVAIAMTHCFTFKS